MSRWEHIYYRGIRPAFHFLKAHWVPLSGATMIALLGIAGIIGVPIAWGLGPDYFEAVGTWVGAVGGIIAILVAGGALYHQRVVDQRAEQARTEAADFDQSELLVRMVRFDDIVTHADANGVWCTSFKFSVREEFHHTIYAARAHGANSDPFEIDLNPASIAPGQSAAAQVRYPEISEGIVRQNEELLKVDFTCWSKRWTARPGGYVVRRSKAWPSPRSA